MDDIGKSKATTAKERLNALNPDLKITVYEQFMDEKLAGTIVPAYDIVVDCLDNFCTRFILNDVCVAAGKPLVHAGIGEYYGQLMTIIPGTGPCLRCLFPNGIKEKTEPEQGEQGDDPSVTPHVPFGVIGPTPGVVGAMQALETAKYLLGLPVASDGLVTYDGLNLTLEKVPIAVNENCICYTMHHCNNSGMCRKT